MRLILYTGKGGVGKSSLAAASALRAAELGRRTLLVSSDLAHNLTDIFDAAIGGVPVEVRRNLTALEVDALKEIRENWQPAQDYFADFLAYLGMENAVAEEVALIPGMEEVFLLTRILRELESQRYDVVMVDCSPTAGTLRLLTFTDTACTKLNKLLNAERQILKLVRPVTNRMKDVRPIIPSDEVYGVFDEMIRKVGQLGEILKAPAVSSVRLVLNPDRVAIAETRRAFAYFGLFGFPVDGVFVNKVLPQALAEGFLHEWFALQQQLLATIDQSFLEVSKFRVPLLGREPIGADALTAVGRDLFSRQAPDEVLSESRPVELVREGEKYRLSFRLPEVAKPDLDIGCKDQELILSVGTYTRVFSLPSTLSGHEVEKASFSEGRLDILFR